jgi:hypothetical protein
MRSDAASTSSASDPPQPPTLDLRPGAIRPKALPDARPLSTLGRVGQVLRKFALFATISSLAFGLAACSSSAPGGGKFQSVFRVSPGQCFLPPSKIQAEVTKVDLVPCTKPHTQEAYAVVAYKATGTSAPTADYPGDQPLKSFADGACAAHFAAYVGVDYQDSSLFFTYLLPSARGWSQGDDRKVVCFVTTNGSLLHKSVKGSKV